MRYLGNKTRMLNNISDFIEKLNIKATTFCDLFSGSCSVSDYFKGKYTIIANDLLFSSYIFAKAKLSNSCIPKFDKFKIKFRKDPFKYFTEKEYSFSDNHFIWKNYSPVGNRQFFSESVANKIDGIRLDIEQMEKENILNKNEKVFLIASLLETVMGLSNTTGTYEAFLKTWDKRALKNFVLKPLEINETTRISKENIVYNEDSNSLIRKISGDILYLDTPYTITDYNSAYHLLETIAKYDNPNIKGITGRRINKKEKSKYSIKSKVADTYEDLIKNANFKHIIISYSTQSLLPIEQFISILKKYSKSEIIIKYYPFREYKNIRSSKKDNELKEILIYLNKNNISENEYLKSPLNYSGSKNYIVDQIINELPKKIDTFIDAMGGAFNVGINVRNIKKLVYNEYNPFVFEIINMLLFGDKEKIIEEIKNIIKKFNLIKGNKNSYLLYRKYYNENKTPLNLFVLQMYCFQNQLRFNQKHDFNSPVGNCGCNKTTFERINKFVPYTKNVITSNKDFNELDINDFDEDSVFYFDPPYIITNATYNDGKRGFKGWNNEEEKKLLCFLDRINNNGQKFLLSNVINHNDKINKILFNWIQKNNYHVVNLKPHSGRYGSREEVLIKNY